MKSLYECTVCKETKAKIFVTIPQAPVLCNILWSTRAEATSVAKADIPLAFCPQCGHIFNPAFTPDLLDYSQVYENSLHYSPHFQQFATDLAQKLIKRHGLYQKRLLEISCGKGDFLTLICQLGKNSGFGFDPSYVPPQDNDAAKQGQPDCVRFVQDFYSEAYSDWPADFIFCRHTLEHIQDPVAFIQMVLRTIGQRSITTYFEVPNSLFTLRQQAIWDIIYEHCNYFSAHSLAYLFTEQGFQVDRVQTTYGDQFLYVEATTSGIKPEPVADGVTLAAEVAHFAETYRTKVAQTKACLADLARAGKKAVIWGAGSKGISFLNTVAQEQIDYAVDLNPRKQGKYTTGTGQEIVAPDFLAHYQPDVIFVMNALYLAEIQESVAQLGLTCDFVCV